jgi:hypothetical protein
MDMLLPALSRSAGVISQKRRLSGEPHPHHIGKIASATAQDKAAKPGRAHPARGQVWQIEHDGQITSVSRNPVKPLNQKYFALPEF